MIFKVSTNYDTMQIPLGEGKEMANSLIVTQGNFNFPSHGLTVVVKKRIPTTRSSTSRGWNFNFHKAC